MKSKNKPKSVISSGLGAIKMHSPSYGLLGSVMYCKRIIRRPDQKIREGEGGGMISTYINHDKRYLCKGTSYFHRHPKVIFKAWYGISSVSWCAMIYQS